MFVRQGVPAAASVDDASKRMVDKQLKANVFYHKGIYAAPPMWGVAGHDVLKYNNAHLRSF